MLDAFIRSTQSKGLSDHTIRLVINALIALQLFSALYFLGDFVTDLFVGNDSARHVFIEGLAVLCLLIGIYFSIRERRRLLSRNQQMESQLQIASGAFRELLDSFFDKWKLTPSEQEIALLTIKGFSNAEIADLRNTREGTVKAQSNAIFRKAGVSGRPQLLSHFIDELVGDPLVKSQDGAKKATAAVAPDSSYQGTPAAGTRP